MFNIIKTNKNKTAMAPTYTTRNVIGRNSKFNKKSRAETLQKERIKNKTEYTGFFEVITKTADNKERLEKRQKKAKKRLILIIIRYVSFCDFTPYTLREVLRLLTPSRSSLPRIATLLTPIRSRAWPALIKIVECCCKLWPSPGILTFKLIRLPIRKTATLAIRRLAEFGFLGDIVVNLRQTARRCGFPSKATFLGFLILGYLEFLSICEIRVINN